MKKAIHESAGLPVLVSESEVFVGKTFRILRRKFQDDDSNFVRDIIIRRDGVVVVPCLSDGSILLISEFIS